MHRSISFIKGSLIAFTFFACIFSACKDKDDNHPCYDASIIPEECICTLDCPGFLGCDGETYCNECIASCEGIGPM